MLAAIKTRLLRIDELLRGRPWAVAQGNFGPRLFHLLTLLTIFGLFYGAVMGSFGGVWGPRFWQVIYSAVKVPLLLTATFLISLPSFFVLNTLAGLRRDFAYALRALLATQAGLTVILASFAPFTILWYVSFTGYQAAILFNTVMFGSASLFAQRLLNRFYQPLIARSARHVWLLRVWLILYAFVGIQCAWMLRPFIGALNAPTQFFRAEAWGNAYVKLAEIISGVF